MTSPNKAPCTHAEAIRHLPESEANRLQNLENEVYRLRNEIDKIKWQRAAAETAIERAIVRGATTLGGRYKIHVPVGSNPDRISNESIDFSARLKKNPCQSEKRGGSVDGINVKENKPSARICGEYTLG